MNRIVLLLAAISFCLLTKAQPYSINFSGTGLLTVKVENLTSGLIVNLSAGDILHLSITTGISESKKLNSSGIKVYPNPMTDKTTLEILPPVAGNANISVYDITGKVSAQFKDYLENCTQDFSLSGLTNGIFLINVQGDGYQFSEKLLSNGKSNGTAIISMVSNNIQSVAKKESIKDFKGVQSIVDMAYNTGDRLKYTGVSGNNSTVMTDAPIANKTVTFTFTECKDGDNNYYPVVQISTQLWMAENLKYLPSVVGPGTGSLTNPYYYVYGYNGTVVSEAKAAANYNAYGVLYNWPAAMNGAASSTANPSGVLGVCPIGWHLPSDDEWTELTDYLGGASVAGSKLKETGISHWVAPNTGSTNETSFTALPGGYRDPNGTFTSIGFYGFWWSATDNITNTWMRYIYPDYIKVGRSDYNKGMGLSVRCIKD